MLITSKQNSLIKEVIALSDKKYRKEYGKYLAEGTKIVDECIACGCIIDKIVCSEELQDKYTDAVAVSKSLFSLISSEKTPQGVIAIVKMPNCKIMPPTGNCLLLDGLQDPGNVGTIIRTANAAGFEEIYLINCTDPFSPKAVRASMSGIFFVKLRQGSKDEVLNALNSVSLVCADMNGENIFSFVAPNKFCICIGNEGSGLSEEVLSKADYTVKIPMQKTCESLNAAVSAGIIMYQLKNNLKR